jgi:nucleoside phosphorylase
MKILIVDDDQNKVSTIKSELLSLDLQNLDIYEAYHAAEARKLLVSTAFDVMLIDVLLPARENAKPNGETSVELLRQIVEDGTSKAPKHIIGVTADLEALQQFKSEFQSLTFHIVEVTPCSDEWKGFLKKFMLHFRRIKEAESTYDFDVCVLAALRDPELKAVLSTWNADLEPEELLTRSVSVQRGTLTYGGKVKHVAFAHLGQMGLVASVHATEALLQVFKPRVLFMTGICGGFSEHVQVGDVVVADKSWDWQSGKWTQDGTLLSAPDSRDASSELVAIAQRIESKLGDFQSAFQGNTPSNRAALVTGPMVSGSSVVASIDIQRVFRKQHRKMVAVDMECYGMYYSSTMTTGPSPETICIKSVSDLADQTKSDDFHKYCSYMSARVALEIMQNYWKSSGSF